MNKTLIIASLVAGIFAGGLLLNESSGQVLRFYPPTVDFERAVGAVLDKLFPNRLFDSYWKKIFHYQTFFESIDNFGKTTLSSATVTADNTEVILTVSNSATSEAGINFNPLHQGLITFSQPSRFKTYVRLSATTSLVAHVVTGNYTSGNQGYGFKITSSTLMGWASNGSTSSTVFMQNISPNISYFLEARYLPTQNVSFFSSDGLAATSTVRQMGAITTTIPSSTIVANQNLFVFDLENESTATTTMRFSFFEYIQRRNVLE